MTSVISASSVYIDFEYYLSTYEADAVDCTDYAYEEVSAYDTHNGEIDLCERVFMSDDEEGSALLCCTSDDRAAMIDGCGLVLESFGWDAADVPTLCSEDESAACEGVETTFVANYIIEYNACDYSYNCADEVFFEIVYEDTTPPVIGCEEASDGGCDWGVEASEKCVYWTPPTITAFDLVSGELDVTFSVTFDSSVDESDDGSFTCTGGTVVDDVDIDTPGTYCVTYEAWDDAGNEADPESYVVVVADTTPPNVELEVYESVVECGLETDVPDAGATSDNLPCSDEPDVTSNYELGASSFDSDGYLFITDDESVVRMRFDGSEEMVVVDGLTQPAGITYSTDKGYIFWSNLETGTISRADIHGDSLKEVISIEDGVDTPSGIAIDNDANRIYFADVGAGTIQRSGFTGGAMEVLVDEGVYNPKNLCIDVDAWMMYWAEADQDGNAAIMSATMDGDDVTAIITDVEKPFGVAVDTRNGRIYYSDIGDDTIHRANVDGSSVEDVYVGNGLEDPRALVFDDDNNLLIVSDDDAAYSIDLDDDDATLVELSALPEKSWGMTLVYDYELTAYSTDDDVSSVPAFGLPPFTPERWELYVKHSHDAQTGTNGEVPYNAGEGIIEPPKTAVDSGVSRPPLQRRLLAFTESIDLDSVGTYIVPYWVSDGYNSATAYQTLVVEDTTAPTITCPDDVELHCGDTFADSLAAVDDACSDDITVEDDSADFSADIVGTFTVTFTATDGSDNVATCTQTVVVEDATDPELNCGGDHVSIEACTGTYVEAGCTASDNYDEDIQSKVTTSGADDIDTWAPGTYFVEYDVCDTAGNCAATATRTVTVADSTEPTIAVVGDTYEVLEASNPDGSTWFLGATCSDACDTSDGADATDFLEFSITAADYYAALYVDIGDDGWQQCLQYSSGSYTWGSCNDYADDVVGDLIDDQQYYCGDSVDTMTATASSVEALQSSNGASSDELQEFIGDLDATCGLYTISYTCTDNNGNTATATQYVMTVDTTAPDFFFGFSWGDFEDEAAKLIQAHYGVMFGGVAVAVFAVGFVAGRRARRRKQYESIV